MSKRKRSARPAVVEPSAAAGYDGLRWLLWLSAMLLLAFYCLLAWLTSGGDVWWHIDVVGNSTIYWGDDAYRRFLARGAFLNGDAYWFSFVLPVVLLLDHLVSLLSADQLLLARFIKALLATGGLILLWQAGRAISIGRTALLVSLALLALMPLYFFVSMSFYGEAWLGLLVCAAIWLHCRGHSLAVLWLVGLFPLVRPEGLFFVLSLVAVVWFSAERRRAWIPLLPGTLYFIAINVAGPGILDYIAWRGRMEDVYIATGDWYGTGWEQFPRVFFIPWLMFGAAGLLALPLRRLAGFSVASLSIFALFSLFAFLLGTASFEARYMLSALPMLTLGVAASLDHASHWLRSAAVAKGVTHAAVAVFVILCLQAQARSVLGIERVVSDWIRTGSIPEDVRQAPFSIGTYFHGISTWGLDKNRELASVVTRMVNTNRDIRTLMVGNIQLFYHLDPEALPDYLRVVFVPVPSFRMVPALGGDIAAGYFATYPYSGYFRLGPPVQGAAQLLYVDRLVADGYPYHWKVGESDIYLFAETEVESISPSESGAGKGVIR